MRKKASNGALWGVLGVVVVGAVGGIAYAMTREHTSPEQRGYTFLSGCAGVNVWDDSKAMSFAAEAGSKSEDFSENPQGWLSQVAGDLGVSSMCSVENFPPAALGFVVRLLGAYIEGSAKAGHVPAPIAESLIENLKLIALAKGVLEKDLA